MTERITYGGDESGYFVEFSNKAMNALTRHSLAGGDNPLEAVNEVLEAAAEDDDDGEESDD